MKSDTMRKGFRVLMLISLLVIGYSANALANAIEHDYGDAPGYDWAWHSDASWQRLGYKYDEEGSPNFDNVDPSDDGVFWSTDGGATWGHPDILLGQTVDFRFDMYKEEWGYHSYDAIKVWIDLNQDNVFDPSLEMIFEDKWYLSQTGGSAGVSTSFGTDPTDPIELIFPDPGVYWLRARVTCNLDINGDLSSFIPTGGVPGYQGWGYTCYVGQGEVEDWKLTVMPVPEPASMLLFGSGLFAMGLFGRKKLFKKS